jgi:uncharacterized membrane protein
MNNPTLWLTLTGLLLVALSVPMMLRRVPPNDFYGLRVPATIRDERVWYDANAASGRDMALFGMFVVLFGLVPPWLGWSGVSHWLTWSAVVVGGAVLTAVVGWRRANRLLREKLLAERKEG